MPRRLSNAPTGMVLADIPERQRLRELQRLLEQRRDEIANADLEIETLREHLADFETAYHHALRAEHSALQRVQALIGHLERWIELLGRASRVPQQATRLDARRQRELEEPRPAAHRAPGAAPDPDDAALDYTPKDKSEQLKSVYRELARRYHPDLARTEAEQLRNSEIMARINALYRDGDLERLLAMREQARGSEVDEPELEVDAQLALLEKRLAWFDTVLKNLHEERAALEASATCELWRNVEQARVAGRDLFAEMRAQALARLEKLYEDVPVAAHSLEDAVSQYNREHTQLTRRGSAELEAVFDPYVDKSMVRLGLDDLGALAASPKARERATWLEELPHGQPALLRLVLLTYVAELSPFPLTGLERYDDLKMRFDDLGADDEAPPRLEQTLTEA
ncbi:MAG TPA: hypothetical protein VFH51_04880, partial [Myxococcota bacterium]|nr:hypothetical protein [Myxococcota bacterium]